MPMIGVFGTIAAEFQPENVEPAGGMAFRRNSAASVFRAA